MLGSTKFLPLILLLICSHHSFALAPFDSFHSNLGEIIILTPKAFKKLGTQEVKPKPQKIPAQTAAGNVETKIKEVGIDEVSAEGTRSKESENKATLSDEEINDLLFDELFEWEEELSLIHI